jgi:hypothetical protein
LQERGVIALSPAVGGVAILYTTIGLRPKSVSKFYASLMLRFAQAREAAPTLALRNLVWNLPFFWQIWQAATVEVTGEH